MSGSGGFTGLDFETQVLTIVKEDPFVTISEIVTDLKDRAGDDSVGWWKVFSLLRRRKLLSRRSRFRHFRRR